MAQVGRAEVEIVADVSRFGRNLQRNLQRAVDNVNVDTRNITRQIGDSFREGTATATQAVRGMGVDVGRSLSETERTATRVGRRIGDTFQETFRRVRRVVSRLSNVLFTFRSRALLFGGAITIALAGIVAALDELAGLLLPLPALLAMVGASVATFNVIARGMSDAFEAAFEDAEKFEEAIEGLAPAAQDVAREFRALVPLFRRIGIDVQQAFWQQLDGTLTEVARNLAGPVRSGMLAVATQMGRIAVEVGEFAASADTARTVALVFSATAESMGNLVEATQPFLEGMRTLVNIFAPRLGGLSATMVDLAIRFRDWTAAVEESGEALESAERAARFLSTLGGIVAQTFRLIGAGIEASHDAGVSLFGTIEELIGAAAELGETAEAQAGLREFFESIDRLIRALLPLLGSAAVQIGRLATPLADLVEALAPGVADILEGIASGLVAMVDSGGREFAEGLSAAFSALSPSLEFLGGALGRLLGALAPLLEPAGALVGILVTLVSTIAEALTPIIETLAGVIASILLPIFQAWLDIAEVALPPLIEAFRDVSEAIAPVIEQLGGLFLQIMEEFLPLAIEHATLIIGGLVFIIEKSIEVWEFWLDVLTRIWGWIKDNIIPIIQEELWPVIRDELIPAILDAREAFREFLDAVRDLWNEILELVNVLVDEADPELGEFRVLVFLVRGEIQKWIAVVKIVTGAIRFLIKTNQPLIKGLRSLAKAIRNVRTDLGRANSVFRTAWRRMKDIIDRGVRLYNVLDDIRDAAGDAASAIANIPSLPSGFGGLFNFFAQGGIVNRATAAIIGEAGPEVVLPLSKPERARELAAESGLMDVLLSGSSNITTARRSVGAGAPGAGGGPSVVVEQGAVVIRFEGVPDEQRARRIGNAAGEGLLNTLAARNVRLAIRST